MTALPYWRQQVRGALLRKAVAARKARARYRYLVRWGQMNPSHELLSELSISYYAARRKWYADFRMQWRAA